MEVEKRAKRILRKGYVCDHCLGRQFAEILTGTGNAQRGRAIRYTLAMEYEIKPFAIDKSNLSCFSFRKRKIPKKEGTCIICDDIFGKVPFWSKKAAELLKDYEFSTFLAGVKLNDKLVINEENLWDDTGLEWAESIKSEINRELGKLISDATGKEADLANPDIAVVLNLQGYEIELDVRSVFVYGRYNKLVRNIPQTRWDKYKTSVEQIIGEPMKRAAKSKDYTLHGMGREDIDARCLGWRPFVMELVAPKKRSIDLKKLENAINRSRRVNVKGLKFSDKEEMRKLKASRAHKAYRAVVAFENPVAGINALRKLKGALISQRTPERVKLRRANIVRKRKVYALSWKKIDEKTYEFMMTGDAGLYIKEFVSGDNGRTRPSISQILKNKGTVKELDVVKFL